MDRAQIFSDPKFIKRAQAARETIAYWQQEYGEKPDAWELSQELGISEKDAEKSLAKCSKQNNDAPINEEVHAGE